MADNIPDSSKNCPVQTPSALPYFYEVTDMLQAVEVYTNREDLKQWTLYRWPEQATPEIPVNRNHPLRQKASKRNREEDDPQHPEQQETTKPYDLDGSSLSFSMQPLIKNLPTVTGLGGFATFVLKVVNEVLEGDIQAIQNTRAIVVQNASGVGKTVGSLAVCKNLSDLAPKFLYLPLYLGFNSSFSLTGLEEGLLQDQSVKSYERVARVVGRRLLLQLQTLVRECNQSSDPNTALKGVLRPDGGWQARTALPTNMTIFESNNDFPAGSNKITEECAALIKQLSEYCGGNGLVVLIILDEGQFLDEFIEPADDSGGARWALRFARYVQLNVAKNAATGSTKMCALPLMTGINPETSLNQGTRGLNEVFNEVLHSRKEFVEVVKAIHVKKKFTDREYEQLAPVFYPVARDAEWYFHESRPANDTQDIEQENAQKQREEKQLRAAIVPRELAPLMLMAGGVEMKLDKSLWHPAVPAKFIENTKNFVPMPSCYRITSYINDCSWIREATLKWLPIHGLHNIFELKSALNLSDDAFEETCGRVFTLILALVNTPFLKSETDWQSWNRRYSFPEISSCFREAQKTLRIKHPWFNIPCDLTEIQEPEELVGAKQVLLPSSCGVGNTTEEAFALKNGIPVYGLFPWVKDILPSSYKTALNALKKKGECYVLRCSGSAPVDFIYVVMLSDKVLTNADEVAKDADAIEKWGECKVAIRLADAKHCSEKWDSNQPSPLDASDVTPMIVKFRLVANYLHAALKNECGMRVVEEKSAIFTNRSPSKPMTKERSISTTWTTATGGTHPLYILSPETFNFPPLTDFLYAWRPPK